MGKLVAIYVLEDPRTAKVFYVGKTETPLGARLRAHICDARAGRNSASADIMDIIDAGLRPIIRQVELIPADGDWIEAEVRWIAYYRATGSISNRADGGQGVSGVLRSAEWYEKVVANRRASGKAAAGAKRAAEKNRGRIQPESQKQKRLATRSLTGFGHTEEAKAKIAVAHKGMTLTQETRNKISIAKSGRTLSDSHKAKIGADSRSRSSTIAEQQVARWKDPEYYDRVTTSMKARKPPGKATRDKLRATTSNGWADDEIRRKREDGMRVSMEDPAYRQKHQDQMKAKWDDPIWRTERLAAQAEGRRKRKLATQKT